MLKGGGAQKVVLTQALKPIFHCDAKFLRWGLALVKTPNTRMFMSKNAKICVTPDAEPKICIIPQRKTQTLVSGSQLAMFFCQFNSCWDPFFSGIWTLEFVEEECGGAKDLHFLKQGGGGGPQQDLPCLEGGGEKFWTPQFSIYLHPFPLTHPLLL